MAEGHAGEVGIGDDANARGIGNSRSCAGGGGRAGQRNSVSLVGPVITRAISVLLGADRDRLHDNRDHSVIIVPGGGGAVCGPGHRESVGTRVIGRDGHLLSTDPDRSGTGET